MEKKIDPYEAWKNEMVQQLLDIGFTVTDARVISKRYRGLFRSKDDNIPPEKVVEIYVMRPENKIVTCLGAQAIKRWQEKVGKKIFPKDYWEKTEY